ncbi:uncharacterized protein LOC114520991 [Dendronephthya gigantea]|uniref:uncharacterized protein LOC114520991 n=1 Tax=Dendronephthya gigantea TaxID=151771 RepID=UPI00106CF394|nr:uncharacterized protein LOC114520991 [Dendronephthya gigantea]
MTEQISSKTTENIAEKMNRLSILTALFKYLLILRFQPDLVSTQSVQDSLQSINITRSDNLDSSDQLSLTVVNATFCQDQNAIDIGLSADCDVVSLETDDSGRDFCNVKCECNNETGSFIVHERRCRDERKFRQGCSLVFGSWSWNNSWVWNSQNDRLLTLYYEDGFGFGGGFNVSTAEYSECGYTSLSTYNDAGGWDVFTIPSNESFISFYELRGYWHFYWLLENLSDNKKLEFEGKFIKIDITCENSNEINGIVDVNLISSCIVFKVTGNITRE